MSVVALGSLTLLGCAREEAQPEPPQPRLFVVAAVHDFGRVNQGEPIRHGFAVENRGRAPLRLLGLDKSYGCSGRADGTLKPGERRTLEVSCDSETRTGRISDDLGLRTNDARSPQLLTMRGEVLPRIGFDSELVSFSTAFGDKQLRSVHLLGVLAAEAKLEPEPFEEPGLSVVVTGAGVELQFLARRVGSSAGRLRFRTGLPRPAELSLSYAIDVKGNLRVDPSTPYLNLNSAKPEELRISVESSRPLELRSLQVSEGPFAARFERSGPKSYAVWVRPVFDKLPSDSRGANGKLLLLSDDPAEPRKEVPLFALGRPDVAR